MKLIGIAGSNADSSYNRLLLQYIGKEFYKMFDLEILEIKDIQCLIKVRIKRTVS